MKDADSILYLRQEIFEHGVYPAPPKLTFSNMSALFQKLRILAGPSNQLSLSMFQQELPQFIQNTTVSDAEAYFITFTYISKQNTNDVANFMMGNIKANQLKVDVPSFSIYFFLQLLSISNRASISLDSRQFNETIKGPMGTNNNYTALNSPRAKAIRLQSSTEHQQMLQYVKHNLKPLLRLIQNSTGPDDKGLSVEEFNFLKILIQGTDSENHLLSTYCPFYSNQARASANQLQEWLFKVLTLREENVQQLCQIQGAGMYINGLSKAVMIKSSNFCYDKPLQVSCCEDSYLYLDSNVSSILIANCVNTTVYISAVQGICTIEKCENVQITVAAHILRIANTIDSTVYYYGIYNPILHGDNRQIILAPHNANYVKLFERLRHAEIPLYQQFSETFSKPVPFGINWNGSYSIIEKGDFYPLVLPDTFLPINYNLITTFQQITNPRIERLIGEFAGGQEDNILIALLAPNSYRIQPIEQLKRMQELQSIIMSQGLTQSQEKELKKALQGHFREWLVSIGSIKSIQELVKLIDQD